MSAFMVVSAVLFGLGVAILGLLALIIVDLHRGTL